MGATVIEKHIQKVLSKYDISIPHLQNINQLTNKLLKERSPDLLSSYFKTIKSSIDEMSNELADLNAELSKRVRYKKRNVQKILDNIQKMYLEYLKRENKIMTSQLEKARDYLFPDNKLQERVFNIIQYMNKYSPNIIDCMKDLLAKESPGSHVILRCWMF